MALTSIRPRDSLQISRREVILVPLFKLFQLISFCLIGLSFFTNLRLGTLTAFDLGAAVYCAGVVPFALLRGHQRFLQDHLLPLSGLSLFVLASLTSASVAHDVNDHLIRSTLLGADVVLMILFCYFVTRFSGFNFGLSQQALVLSSALTGAICIAQAKFGMFHNLLQTEHIEAWTRPSGLVEHPVEAGIVAAYGALFSVNLILNRERVLLNATCLCIIAFSQTVFASLTGIICSVGGVCALLVLRGSVRVSSVFLLLVLAGAFGFFFSDALQNTLAADRLSQLSRSGLQYETLATRSTQMLDAMSAMMEDGTSLLLGFGYDPNALISGLDIHNGLLAAWYHFGLLGALSQALFVTYFFQLAFRKSRNERVVSLIAFSIFILFYLSGPAFFRRSVWVPLFLMAESRSVDPSRRTSPLGAQRTTSPRMLYSDR